MQQQLGKIPHVHEKICRVKFAYVYQAEEIDLFLSYHKSVVRRWPIRNEMKVDGGKMSYISITLNASLLYRYLTINLSLSLKPPLLDHKNLLGPKLK